jgi:DNA-binding CsgD family transcriptional regulator
MTDWGVRANPDAGEYETTRQRPALIAVFLVFASGFAVDLVLDKPARWWDSHVIFELSLMALSLSFAGYLWLGWRKASRSLAAARVAFQAREAEWQAWRERARPVLEGVAKAIDAQFDAWRLTPAEREIALLLVKGHGHKQIAALTDRSERTVRQHAVAVYSKAGLLGRAELAAFFLEGLINPASEWTAPRLTAMHPST